MISRKIVYESIDRERDYQDEKWGSLEEKNQSIAGFLLIMQSELNEAIKGWMKNDRTPRNSVLAEVLQVVSTGVACLEQHTK